ncbi:MAG: S8 family serine peptidase [Planctomycetes bacterium]|nr:S8 family serine peptidase [Planctomycetota bacterium]
MHFTTVWRSGFALILCALANSSWALDGSVPGIHGDVSRSQLGDGTGIIVGIIDSGVDDLHPALAGLDSQGNPRLVAEANFVTSEPGNTGDDVFGHGTWVASAALSRDATFTGMATDARYVNARVLNNSNSFGGDTQVKNGIGFAINQGADILNLSLNFFAPNSNGFQQIDLMLDWAAYSQGISCAICAGNISTGNGSQFVRSPGSAFNGVTVGRTTADFSRVHTDSAHSFTADGRMKPDVVAPGSALTLANDDWETQADWDANLSGCSFAAPHVAGLMAQQLEAGNRLGLSTDPLVVKATIMNGAEKVLDKQGLPWQPNSATNFGGLYSTSQPLDLHSGAGQVDGALLSTQYLAGEMAPGLVDPIGWDLSTVGSGQFVDYAIDPKLNFGTKLSATLTWNRHVGRTDNGNNIVDAGDTFFVAQSLSNLNLQLLKDGNLIAQSISGVDNVEHLYFDIDQSAQYTLRVLGTNVFGGPEKFALAWFGTAVPEPGSFALLCLGIASFAGRRWRQGT